MVWGSFEVRFADGYSALPHQAIIVAWCGWGVCDAGHQAFVMKKCGAGLRGGGSVRGTPTVALV
jgi:hypothetical protein